MSTSSSSMLTLPPPSLLSLLINDLSSGGRSSSRHRRTGLPPSRSPSPSGSSRGDSLGAKTSTVNAGDIIDCIPRSQSPTLTIPHPDNPESAKFWGREIPLSPPKRTYVDLDRDDMLAWLHKVEVKCQASHFLIKKWAIHNFSMKDRYCITTPNVEYIPEQPALSGVPEIMNDGLLGLYEWMMHPCNFLPHRPHEVFITLPNSDDLKSSILSRPLHRTDMIFLPNNPVGRLHNRIRGNVERIFKFVGNWLPYAVMIWRQFQCFCVDLITFCDYHKASNSIRMHLLPAQTACTKFRGAFSPGPNVIKLLACLGAPAFHVRILDESPPLESKVQLGSWTVFEGFHAPVAKGEDWHVPELFIDMFESMARIQAPPTLVPDVDRFASFLDVDESNFLFSSRERCVTGGLGADSDRMDIDSPLRPPPYDILAVGSDGIDFYNFKDMGQEDGLEPGEAHEHSDYEVDIGDFDEEMFRKQPQAHPVDFMQWDEGNMDPGLSTSSSSRKRRCSPSLCEQTPVTKSIFSMSGFRVALAVSYPSGYGSSRAGTCKDVTYEHMNTSGNDVSATRNPIVKSSKRRISSIEELPAGTVRRRRTRSSSQEPVFIPEGFEETDTRILRGEWPPKFLVTWAVTPVERWEQARNSVCLSESRQIKLFNDPTRRLRVNPKVVTFAPPPHIFYNTVRLSVMNPYDIGSRCRRCTASSIVFLLSALWTFSRPHHLQNSECWRHSLSGVLPADLKLWPSNLFT
ncbi:hypothetical protein K439DRAFT_1625230 [Ramaria rubella]|nr:hypothetical protein K439DRAFT_1625230 [Ramaria rubella]